MKSAAQQGASGSNITKQLYEKKADENIYIYMQNPNFNIIHITRVREQQLHKVEVRKSYT